MKWKFEIVPFWYSNWLLYLPLLLEIFFLYNSKRLVIFIFFQNKIDAIHLPLKMIGIKSSMVFLTLFFAS